MRVPFEVRREAVVPYSCEQMYSLVSDVDSYSSFLPWCPQSRVEERNGSQVKARIAYHWKGMKGSFVTRNVHVPHSSIAVELLEGPFKELRGQWTFMPLADHACKLRFVLHFTFRNRLYQMTAGPLFKHLADSLFDAFLNRAQSLRKV